MPSLSHHQQILIFLLIFCVSDGVNSDVESTILNTDSNSDAVAINPDYGITNITTQIGTNAYLPCKVRLLFNKSVSWVRVRDDHILTVDLITFIADARFNALSASKAGHQPGPWTLQIKFVQPRDEGIYECQVSSEPKISARIYLHVVVPRTELIGESTIYVKEGSRVTLRCVVSGAIDPPLYIIWYHGNLQIFSDNKRGWRSEINRDTSSDLNRNQKTIGSLMIPSVKRRDTGNYSCNPSNSEPVNVMLHIINGEYSASAITSSSTTEVLNMLVGVLFIILMVFQT